METKEQISKVAENTANNQQKRIIGRPFPKGVSGNPAGKPKGTLSLTSIIKRKLQELKPDGKTEAIEQLASNIIQDALDHSDKMREIIWDRLDGKVVQGIESKNTNVNIDISPEQYAEVVRTESERVDSEASLEGKPHELQSDSGQELETGLVPPTDSPEA